MTPKKKLERAARLLAQAQQREVISSQRKALDLLKTLSSSTSTKQPPDKRKAARGHDH